jgi:hypothetical protein
MVIPALGVDPGQGITRIAADEYVLGIGQGPHQT